MKTTLAFIANTQYLLARNVRVNQCDGAPRKIGRAALAKRWQQQMRSCIMVIVDIARQDVFEMTLTQNNHAIQAISAYGPNHPFRMSVRVGDPDR